LKKSLVADLRKQWHLALRKVFGFFPRPIRFRIFRAFVQCDPNPDARLVLKIADTQEELEQCFAAARRLRWRGFHEARAEWPARHHLPSPADHHHPVRQV
jgi:hypothetical protein